MKGESNIDPGRFVVADFGTWLAAYSSMSGLVDANTYAFAFVAAATCRRSNSLAAGCSSTIGSRPLRGR